MAKVDARDMPSSFSCSTGYESEIVESLKASLAKGDQWPMALLKAVKDWSLAEEEIDGETYRYLLLGEAFDWLVLAKRLLDEVEGIIPHDEEEALIFHGKLPWELSEAQFRKSMGEEKYRAHLNYFYGVVVEESLLAYSKGKFLIINGKINRFIKFFTSIIPTGWSLKMSKYVIKKGMSNKQW